MAKPAFSESAVIYHSEEDGCWIAHGLRTDQIGTGDSLVHALADLMRAVHQIVEEAENDNSLAVLRPAPKEIQDMLAGSRNLPKELSEIAHKMAFGKWPQYLNADISPNDNEDGAFKTEDIEVGCA